VIDSAVASGCLSLAVAMALPTAGRPPPPHPSWDHQPNPTADEGWLRRWRTLWSLLAGAAALTFLSMPLAALVAAVAVATVWVVVGRAESPATRQEREAARRDLPHLVGLLADALAAGQSPTDALALVTGALPGPASDRLAGTVPRLRLGIEPHTVWAALADDPALAPLGRALSRAEATGASVVAAVQRLAEALAEDVRGEVEDRARAVGVKAALPLGLCLLPSFVLLGVVPVVAGMLGTLGL
jgi:Flp pilus assembly protein TadB